ncbi:hypothetical protein [Bradyrhizobium sp. CCBAU 51765]|uniref:hypothetical protein n=1 Tax=Bradyrhizobium sp. CCBAU 51765 TaxID=1325102 RepID=UPI001886CFC5|nr:hypothetical protein [Bradyrhizobium sp. CCBAU 51765]
MKEQTFPGLLGGFMERVSAQKRAVQAYSLAAAGLMIGQEADGSRRLRPFLT